jgi:hypothetical protein
MANRVKRKVLHKSANEWRQFMAGLQTRLTFHEQKAKELRPLIADLERIKESGMALPGATSKMRSHSATRN